METQTQLNEEEFYCPTGKKVYETEKHHNKLCKFKNCKKNKWKWSKGLIPKRFL